MFEPVLDIIKSISNASKFSAFVRGTDVILPSGQKMFIKVENSFRSNRPKGFRFSKFSYVTEVSAGEIRERGFGEAETQLLAYEKSIAEGVERVIFRIFKNDQIGTDNSNGWAAHLSPELAAQSGLYELLERDAILVHWLCQIPMTEISIQSCPKWIQKWVDTELCRSPFPILRILVSNRGYVPVISTALMNKDGYGVISHATSPKIENAVYKALAETCRIAHAAIEDADLIESSKNFVLGKNTGVVYPEDHAFAYAHHLKIPAWIFGIQTDWSKFNTNWKSAYSDFHKSGFQYRFNQAVHGPLIVGYCQSDQVQNLYFGSTQLAESKGFLNLKRLMSVRPSGKFTQEPHCVA